MKRNRRTGRFESQAQQDARAMRTLKLMGLGVLFTIALGVAGETIHSPKHYIAPVADASYTPDWDPCTLNTILCDSEHDVETATKAVSEALGREVTDVTKERIKTLHNLAMEHSVPFYDAVKTVYCESMWYSVQSYITKGGKREESYGLAQIHVPSHKIDPSDALDPSYALRFLVENWDKDIWYGYDRETGQCTNKLTIDL